MMTATDTWVLGAVVLLACIYLAAAALAIRNGRRRAGPRLGGRRWPGTTNARRPR